MNRQITIIIVSTIIGWLGIGPARANPDGGSPVPLFTQHCTGERASGFNWNRNKWEAVSFQPARYIVRKIEIPSSDASSMSDEERSAHINCDLEMKGYEFDFGNRKQYRACMEIVEFGSAYDFPLYELCEEEHTRNDETGTWQIDFRCPEGEFYLTLNGWFHTSRSKGLGAIHSKDSLYMEVGQCRSGSNSP